MQVRSGYVIDLWELPRSAPFSPAKAGRWVTHRYIESAAGRLVWVSYDLFWIKPVGWQFYQVPAQPLVPGQRGPTDAEYQLWRWVLPQGMTHRRIPYVADWHTYHGRGCTSLCRGRRWPSPLPFCPLCDGGVRGGGPGPGRGQRSRSPPRRRWKRDDSFECQEKRLKGRTKQMVGDAAGSTPPGGSATE